MVKIFDFFYIIYDLINNLIFVLNYFLMSFWVLIDVKGILRVFVYGFIENDENVVFVKKNINLRLECKNYVFFWD